MPISSVSAWGALLQCISVSHPTQIQFACSKTILQCKSKQSKSEQSEVSFRGALLIWTITLQTKKMSLILFKHDPNCYWNQYKALVDFSNGASLPHNVKWYGYWSRQDEENKRGRTGVTVCAFCQPPVTPFLQLMIFKSVWFQGMTECRCWRQGIIFLISLCTRNYWMAADHSINDTLTMTQPLFQQKGSGIHIKK